MEYLWNSELLGILEKLHRSLGNIRQIIESFLRERTFFKPMTKADKDLSETYWVF
jgi:hypothetical protein